MINNRSIIASIRATMLSLLCIGVWIVYTTADVFLCLQMIIGYLLIRFALSWLDSGVSHDPIHKIVKMITGV